MLLSSLNHSIYTYIIIIVVVVFVIIILLYRRIARAPLLPPYVLSVFCIFTHIYTPRLLNYIIIKYTMCILLQCTTAYRCYTVI